MLNLKLNVRVKRWMGRAFHCSIYLFFFISAFTVSAGEFPPLDEYGDENFDLAKLPTNKPVHICEHPQLTREGHKKISEQVNTLISNENYTQILLIDAKKSDIAVPSNECLHEKSPAESEPWKSLFAIFSPYVKVSYAQGGIINFKANGKAMPQEFIFSGQNFNMCILHTIDNLTDAFVSAMIPEIVIRFKADAILLQEDGQNGISLPKELGEVVTLKELIDLHPKIAVDLFQKYVDYVCDGANSDTHKYHKEEKINCSFTYGKTALTAKTNNELSGEKTFRNIMLLIE